MYIYVYVFPIYKNKHISKYYNVQVYKSIYDILFERNEKLKKNVLILNLV